MIVFISENNKNESNNLHFNNIAMASFAMYPILITWKIVAVFCFLRPSNRGYRELYNHLTAYKTQIVDIEFYTDNNHRSYNPRLTKLPNNYEQSL